MVIYAFVLLKSKFYMLVILIVHAKDTNSFSERTTGHKSPGKLSLFFVRKEEMISYSYLRECHLTTLYSSSKKAKTFWPVIDSRLRTLECKPIDSGILPRATTTFYQASLEAACCNISCPNESRIMNFWWFVPMIDGNEHSHRGSTGKIATKWNILAMKSVISHRLNDCFPLLSS